MSISTTSTFPLIKQRLQEADPTFNDFYFDSNTGIGVYGFSVFDGNIGTNLVSTYNTGYTANTNGHLSFCWRLSFNNSGIQKQQEWMVCMIRESDRQVKIGKYTDFSAGAGTFTFNSFYYDAGNLYLNFTDPTGPTNYYLTYTYSSGTFTGRTAGQYTTGTLLTVGSQSFAGYTWTGQAYTYYEAPISYYGAKAQFS